MSIFVDIKKDFGEFVLKSSFETGDDITALLGASGCGKSMTLKCIAGIVRPDSGRIVVNDRVLFDSAAGINIPPQKRRVGLLFQNYALFPNMTVRQNIMTVISKTSKKDAEKHFKSLCEKFYIADLEDLYPSQLSGGQQQRTALARIMASGPDIIMLDEPLSALDSYLRWQLEDELARIFAEYRGTILYVSHNRDEVYRLCDRVCVMTEGRTEPLRTVRDLFECPDTLASAILSGCKNYSQAASTDSPDKKLVHAVDWNVDLLCEDDIHIATEYIGVRAHYFHKAKDDDLNKFDCKIIRIVDDVFSTIVYVRPLTAESTGKFSNIRIEMPKEEAATLSEGEVLCATVDPADIMQLRA